MPAVSSLAAQLAKLSGGAQGYLLQKNKPSLLFDRKQAAQMDKDSLLSLARTGLEDFISQNSAFKEFEVTLFSDKFKDLNRSLMTQEENQKIDELVTKFLLLLSPYFLQASSFKVLEWLIRHFQVNEMNVNEMMRCILPYHETRQFIRVLQTLLLADNARWSFLMTVQKSQVPLDRVTLVQKCFKDNSILSFICETAKISYKEKIPHRSLYVFVACTLVQYVQTATQVTQQDVLVLLPPLTSFLKIQAPEFGDLQAAAQMIVTQMAAKVQFDSDLVIRLVRAVTKGMTSTNMGSCLLMIVTVCQLQVELTEFPETAMETMLSFSGLANEIVSICSSYVTDKFMAPFIKTLLAVCLKDQENKKVSEVIDTLCRSGYVKTPLSTTLCQTVVQSVPKEDSPSASLIAMFKLMHLSFSTEMDETISAHFAKVDLAKKSADPVFALSKSLFKGTFSEPIADSGTSLFLSLENPNAGLRLCALKTLCKSISSKDQSNFDSDIVQDILLNRIADENPEIVKYVLQVKNLTLLVSDHTRLAKALERLLWSDMNIDIRSLALPLFLSLSKDENNHDIVMTSLFACAFASNETYRFTQALHASLEKTKTPSDLAFLVAVKVPAHLENPEEMVKYNTKLAQALTSSVFEKFSALFINGLESSIASFQALSFMVINDAIAKKKVTLDICLQTVGVLSRFTEFANCELPKESLWALTGLPNASVLTGMTRIKSRRFKESKMFSNLCLITLHNLVLFTVGSGSINSWSLKFKETVSLEYLAFKMFDMISSLKSQAVVDTLTQDMFAGQFKDSQIEFCCAIVTNDVPVQSKSLAMKLLKSFLAASKMDFQLVAPSLLVACSDLDSTVRMGAFDLIKTLAASYDLLVELKSEAIHHNDSFYGSSTKQVKSLKPKKVKPFLADILTHREEIMADHSFLSTAMDKAISGKDEVLAFLLTNILAMPYVSVQSKLMRILSDVSTSSKLKTLFPLLENIRKSQSLSQEEHIFAEDILNCYTPKAVEVLFKSKNPRYASVFLDLIKFTQNGSEQHQTLCSIALRQITSDFFTSAGSEKQCLIVDALIRLIAEAPVEVTQTAREALSRIGISAEHICFILGNVTKVLDQGDEAPSKKAKKDGTKLVKTLHFVTVLLEVVESQNKISNSQEIIPHLFTLLKTALGMESSGSLMQLEYIKQLAMSTLNSVFKTLLNAKVCVDESIVDIDAIIQSVRMTQNAQTHNVAFLLLSTIATGYSNLVLKSVMPIFTFMGANVLPKDDEFSFYVIKKTVDVLLPALVLHSNSPAEIQSILDIFMDALYHIPRHRRLPIFKILVQRLGEEAYLGQILVMVISKARSKKDKSSATNLEFAHQLIAEFGVLSQLSGLIHLLNHVNDLVEKEEEEEDDAHGALQMIRFTKAHLTAKACASSVLRVPETERAEKQMTLIEALLVLVGKLDAESAKPLFEALDLVMDLLSLPKYVEAIVALMHHDNAAVCIRAISMMEEKIQAAENTEETTGLMTCLVPELLLVLQSTGDEDDDDLLEKKQIALSCLGELARFMAKNKPVLFAETVPLIIGDHGLLHANPRVSSSAMVTLSFICTGIGSRILPYLPKFMPSLLSMLSESLAKGKKMDSNLASLVCQACFMALQSVVETIPTFVSPYVSDIISHAISPVACSLDTSASVLTVLSSKVPARVVLPAIMKQIPSVFDSGPESVAALFKFVTSVMGTITRSEITDFMPDLTKFFLESFDVRLKATKLTEDELSSCETDIINSFLQLVLKLNETYFKPLFLKMVDWCTLNISFAALEEKEKIKRQLVMFKLLDEFLDRLKALAVPYYSYVLDTSLALLSTFSKTASADSQALWKLNLSSLAKYFMHDDQEGDMDDKKFDKIVNPLLDQVEVPGAHGSDYLTHMMDYVIPAVGQFALRASSEPHRKALNRAVCMATRSTRPEVRLAGIYILKEMYDKVGDAMLVFFPETIPFLAELMEDEDEDVEGACQDLCAVIQGYLGEPIQQYFMSS